MRTGQIVQSKVVVVAVALFHILEFHGAVIIDGANHVAGVQLTTQFI